MGHVDQIYISLTAAQQACVFFFALFKTKLMVFLCVCFFKGEYIIWLGIEVWQGCQDNRFTPKIIRIHNSI